MSWKNSQKAEGSTELAQQQEGDDAQSVPELEFTHQYIVFSALT